MSDFGTFAEHDLRHESAEWPNTAANIDNEVKLSGSSQTAENGFVHTIRACDAPFTFTLEKGAGKRRRQIGKESLETSSERA